MKTLVFTRALILKEANPPTSRIIIRPVTSGEPQTSAGKASALARKPRGFEDRTGDVLRAEQHLISKASQVYDDWGFEPLQTPAFEYAEALGKFLPDEERPNEGVFALEDDDGQWMSLRYDHTAPLARFVAEHYQDLNKPYRRYQAGDVWRNEKPGPGRFRQFVQCDADTVGSASPAADAEMIALAAQVMSAVGLETGDFLVRVNDRRILDGVLETIGAADAERRMRVLRAADKLDRLGRDGVALLLGEGRKDESGLHRGGWSRRGRHTVLSFLDAGGGSRGDVVARLEGLVSDLRLAAGIAALNDIDAVLSAIGVADDRAVFDPSVVRGLGDGTGPS